MAWRGLLTMVWLAGSAVQVPTQSQLEAPQPIPTESELRQCPHLAPVNWQRVSRDLAAYRATHPAAAGYDIDGEHRRIRGPWPLPDLSRAEIVIDIAIGSGETQRYPTSTSSFAWREPGGVWQVDRVDYVIAPLPPPSPNAPPMDAEAEGRAKRPVIRGPLEPEKAAAIDRVLADPCFAIQPDYTPMQLPLLSGASLPCYGAISRTIRIRRGDETRNVTDLCGRWPSAEMAQAIMYASLSLDTIVEQSAQARFPGAGIRITELREGQARYYGVHLHCGAMTVDGRPTAMMFEAWRNGAWPRNDLYLPGEPYREGGTFESVWQSRCTAAATPAARE